MVLANAKNAHEQKFELVERKESRRYEGMEQLCNLLQKEIHRIELFDNSHISGTHNVSGMVAVSYTHLDVYKRQVWKISYSGVYR